jgi:hypothetical protein
MKVWPMIRYFALAPMLLTLIAACTAEPDRVLMRRYAGYGYCNMKIETAGDPSRPTEREVVDYYGPCDERPTPRR